MDPVIRWEHYIPPYVLYIGLHVYNIGITEPKVIRGLIAVIIQLITERKTTFHKVKYALVTKRAAVVYKATNSVSVQETTKPKMTNLFFPSICIDHRF